MSTAFRRLFGALVLVLAFAGCSLLPHSTPVNSGGALSIGAAYSQINTSVVALQASQASFKASLDALVAHWGTSSQFVADRLTEIAFLNDNNPGGQNAVTMLMDSQITAALTALGLPPSADVKDREIEDLKLALSTAASDKATLVTRNQDLTTQATLLAGQTKLLTQQVSDKEVTLLAATTTVATSTDALHTAATQATIDAAQTKAAQDAAAKAAAAKERLATARWFMVGGGILMALGVVGLFLGIREAWLASVAGGALFGLGWGITEIEDLLQQPWFKYTAGGLILFGLAAAIWFVVRALQHRTASQATSSGFQALVGAVEEAASKNPALSAQLQPILQEWLVTDKGVPDQAVITQINQMAASLNVVNPGQAAVASGTVAVVKPVQASPVPAAPVSTPAPVSAPATH